LRFHSQTGPKILLVTTYFSFPGYHTNIRLKEGNGREGKGEEGREGEERGGESLSTGMQGGMEQP
jgi:hypothetical protein